MDQKVTKQHLDQAERDLAAGQQLVDEQKRLVATMRRDGHDSTMAEQLLQTFEHSLDAMKHHRNVILEELGLYRAGESGSDSGVQQPDKGSRTPP